MFKVKFRFVQAHSLGIWFLFFSIGAVSAQPSVALAPTLKIEILGFNKVAVSSNINGRLYRQVSGKILPVFGITPDDLKGKLIAGNPVFPYIDTVPVSLSEVSWRYMVHDRNNHVLVEAATDPMNWPENLFPELIAPNHPGWIVLYKKAWELNWLRTVTSNVLPAHFASNATPDNNMSYVWDACFNLLFQRYAAMSGGDPTVATLDNFYAEQAKSGYIDRYFNTLTFAPGWNTTKDVASMEGVNPPLFAWAEWDYYLMTADSKRLESVLPKLIKHYYFIDSFLQVSPGKYKWEANPSGWDNILEVQKHKYWIELPAMQALSAQCIVKIAKVLNREKVRKTFANEIEQKRIVLDKYWNSEKKWYCSLDDHGGFTGKTLNGMWPVLAGIVPADKLKLMVNSIMDPKKFLTGSMPLPVLAKDESGYDPEGKYWHGSVWINISLMAIRGLYDNGYSKEAQELAIRTLNGMVRVFNEWQPKPHTLWECYSPEFTAPASHKVRTGLGSVRSDFADWTSCLINLLIENVMGIQANAPANTIIWSIRMEEEHGIKRLRFGQVTTDLLRKKNNLIVYSNKQYTLKVLRNGKIHDFKVNSGINSFSLLGFKEL